ncbi:CobW family GTP-binding protein [Kocuria sp. M1N1S27]|uniref:CobW family GTP-binding protein n=1 Tax=Kocuria kalidii TaxID=3376283 RepID=UPI0037A72B8F
MTARLGIIGGYLGSGKSTLVNRLLAGVLPGRVAVVVNDFGSVNIDADLIASASGDTVELTNGCICCQISDDAARTMSALAARGDLDHVLCEVSGVGDPGQLAAWRDFPGFSPGPVLVCADATAVRRLLGDEYVGDTVRRQLTAAEVVLVTKTDLALPPEVADAAEACRRAAPRARLLLQDPVDPGATAAEALAGAAPGAADDGGAPPDPALAQPDDPAEPDDHAALDDLAEPDDHAALDDFAEPDDHAALDVLAERDDHAAVHVSAVLECPGPLDVEALAGVLADRAERLVRAKGILRGTDGRWHEVQLAGGRVDVRSRPPGRPAPGRPALVLIAAGPDAEESLRAVRAALAPLLEHLPGAPPGATAGPGTP